MKCPKMLVAVDPDLFGPGISAIRLIGAYSVFHNQEQLKTRIPEFKLVPKGNQDMLKPNLGSELAVRVRKRPSGWHVAANMHEIHVD